MTKLAELEKRLIETADPAEHARVRQEIREAGLPQLAAALDCIAAKGAGR